MVVMMVASDFSLRRSDDSVGMFFSLIIVLFISLVVVMLVALRSLSRFDLVLRAWDTAS